MAIELRHYVGHLFLENVIHEKMKFEILGPEFGPIRKRDASLVVIPPKEQSYGLCLKYMGFKFFDRNEGIAPDGEVLRGKKQNISVMHYVGTIPSPRELERAAASLSQTVGGLLRTGLETGETKWVKTGSGDFTFYMILRAGDVVIPRSRLRERKRWYTSP